MKETRRIAPWLALVAGSALARGYGPAGRCAGFDRVDVSSPKGTCVALVADEAQGLRMPRSILEVAPGRYWVTDMGTWEPQRGRLLELSLPPPAASPPQRAAVRVLAEGLDRPHGLARGPDGQVYVGEAGRIWRSPVPAPGQPLARRETVIDKLPADGAHPLKALAFGPGGLLYVNVGAASDACRNDRQQQPYPCPELGGPQPRAAVYEARLATGPGTPLLQGFAPYATGLRNSLALAVTPDGRVWQGENNIDYPEATQPPEELNRLERGRDYGWPYCVGAREPARGYAGRHDCARDSTAPAALWPAHVAPLAMAVAPPGSPWPGQLLVAWHGYRSEGHRVVRIARDAHGRATGAPLPLLWGWDARPGTRPLGKPAGLAIDSQGRLLVVEDINRSVLMLLPQAPAPR